MPPNRVVTLLNHYFAAMIKVIKQYDGTIDEFIGDAIFVLFGAPTWRDDDAERALACAVAMQLAMPAVNEHASHEDLPELEMGIGINTGQVVVGNIGSVDRMKYGVVGSQVNLTSRIQSCTTGGQILISETTRKELGTLVRFGKRLEIKAKGIAQPVALHEALGVGGSHKLFLPAMAEPLVTLVESIEFRFASVEGERVDSQLFDGRVLALSSKGAEVVLQHPVATLSNLVLHFTGSNNIAVPGVLYAKVIGASAADGAMLSLRFSSMSPEIAFFLRAHRAKGRLQDNDAAHVGSAP